MELLVRQVQLILNAPVGPLNEIRKQRITESLGASFLSQPTPVQGSIAFINPMNRETIFVAENQLHYTADGENLSYQPERALQLLGAVRDVLLLEDRFPTAIQCMAHLDAKGSATERSVERLSPIPPSEMRARFEGLRGIGLRIVFEALPYTCDFRVEPLFADPSYIFLHLQATTQTPMSLAHIVEDAGDWLARLKGEFCDFVTEILPS